MPLAIDFLKKDSGGVPDIERVDFVAHGYSDCSAAGPEDLRGNAFTFAP